MYYPYTLGQYLAATNTPGAAHDDATEQGLLYVGDSPPDLAIVQAWTPGGNLTDVDSPIPAISKGYQDSEAQRAEAIKLLKSVTAYALGAKLGGDLAAANPPTTQEEIAALKAAAQSAASQAGGVFFDKYFGWIGAFREGGGPGFLAAIQADEETAFLDWPTLAEGIKLPGGQVVLPQGGTVRDLFTLFLTPPGE